MKYNITYRRKFDHKIKEGTITLRKMKSAQFVNLLEKYGYHVCYIATTEEKAWLNGKITQKCPK